MYLLNKFSYPQWHGIFMTIFNAKSSTLCEQYYVCCNVSHSCDIIIWQNKNCQRCISRCRKYISCHTITLKRIIWINQYTINYTISSRHTAFNTLRPRKMHINFQKTLTNIFSDIMTLVFCFIPYWTMFTRDPLTIIYLWLSLVYWRIYTSLDLATQINHFHLNYGLR